MTINNTLIVPASSESIINRLQTIYRIGGWRERNILNNLYEVKETQHDHTYHVYKFIDTSGNSFEYEYNSNRIVG